MNKYPKLVFMFNRNKQASKTKTAPVVARIRFGTTKKFYPTSINLYIDEWNPIHMVVRRDDAPRLNERLNTIMSTFNKFINELVEKNAPFRFEDYEAYVERGNIIAGSIIDFCEERILNRPDIKSSTRKGHMRLVHALKKYNKIVKFSDATAPNIIAFNEWLYKQFPYKQSAVYYYHKVLRTYINIAIRMDIMKDDPYKKVSYGPGNEEVIRYITESEIIAIKNADIQGKRLQRARDLFVFQCYTGLAYADLAAFDFSKVTTEHSEDSKSGVNYYVLRGRRIKTNTPYVVLLLKPALEILEKYNNQLPVISNQKYNEYLKDIGAVAEVSIPLTSHVARHTFATLCLNKGMNIKAVSKALGHSRVQMTEKYAKLLDNTVQNEMTKLGQKLMQ